MVLQYINGRKGVSNFPYFRINQFSGPKHGALHILPFFAIVLIILQFRA
jgi:hypothetical protein